MINTEDIYPEIVSQLMIYINEIKTKDKKAILLEIIMDFALKNSYEMELVGDAIKSDHYLQAFIEKDCQFHNYIASDSKTESKELDSW